MIQFFEAVAPVLDDLAKKVVGQRVESLDNRGRGTVKMVRFGSSYRGAELFVEWDRKMPGWIEVQNIRWLNEEGA